MAYVIFVILALLCCARTRQLVPRSEQSLANRKHRQRTAGYFCLLLQTFELIESRVTVLVQKGIFACILSEHLVFLLGRQAEHHAVLLIVCPALGSRARARRAVRVRVRCVAACRRRKRARRTRSADADASALERAREMTDAMDSLNEQ